MNLVKISEDLKDVPLPALQQYMNGSNPEIPPYLAQGEMMRRLKMQEKQKLAQGAQGQTPSVKDLMDEAAKRMAVEQQRQQQGMQQMGQQAQQAPQPTTEQTPQPNTQPQGIAAAQMPPGMFAMRGGGIVGYQEGGTTRRETVGQKRLRELLEQGKITYREFEEYMANESPQALIAKGLVDGVKGVASTIGGIKGGPKRTYMPDPDAPSIYADREEWAKYRGRQAGAADQTGAVNRSLLNKAEAGMQPLAMPQQEQRFPPSIPQANRGMPATRPAPTRPAAPQPGIPGVLPPNLAAAGPGGRNQPPVPPAPMGPPRPTMEEMSEGVLRKTLAGPDAYTPEMAGQQESKLAEQSGLAALAGQREDMRKQYADMQKGRGLETFIATMGAGGRYGPGGSGYGYLQAQGQQRNADLAFADRMYGKDAEAAGTRYETQKGLFSDGRGEESKQRTEQRRLAELISPTTRRTKEGAAGSTADERMMNRVLQLEQEGKAAEAKKLMETYLLFKRRAEGKTEAEVRSEALRTATTLLGPVATPEEVRALANDFYQYIQGGQGQSGGGGLTYNPGASPDLSSVIKNLENMRNQK